MGEVFDPRSVANFIVDARRFLEVPTTPLELQKLLFFSHASFLKAHGDPLVAGNFEAWEFGPVHPLVYKSFKSFGDRPISKRATSRNVVTGKETVIARPDKLAQRHVVKIVSSLLGMTAGQLVELSHARNGPWDEVWRKRGWEGAVITDRMILEHYSYLLPLRSLEDKDASIIYRDIPPYDD